MEQPKKINICIIRNDKMGDMILTFPIIKAIKLSYPNSNIVVICSNTNSFLCEEAPFIDKYYIMDKKVYDMLKKSAEADKAKALLSLELLTKNAVGIGDHTTEDFYKNCEEALRLLASAEERIETLDKYFK